MIKAGGIKLFRKGRIADRFRRISILLYTIAFIVMATVMFYAFNLLSEYNSSDYAERYAASSADALSAHIEKEIGVISVAIQSEDVIEWLADEFNEVKKERAFIVLSNIVSQLYSYNLYIGVAGSLNEYRVELGGATGEIKPVAVLNKDEPEDAWFFDTMISENNYLISINIDHFMQRKRVWLDYRIELDGKPLGVLCTGLEFSHVVGELFSKYESNNMRGLIINKSGDIYMDSSLMDDKEFLYNEYITNFREVFSDPAMTGAVEAHKEEMDGYWRSSREPDIIRLSSGQFQFMTIVPIGLTDWSIIILSQTTTLGDTMYFLPVLMTVLLLLVAFAIISSVTSYHILFKPLKKLEDSLSQLNEHSADSIYGVERDDELGHLSNTIQDLFNKANIDPLTGLYNRRFMDSSMERVMGLLSRSEDGILSVLMLDIDFFKRFNDTYGHDEGDRCLQAVSHALSHSVSRVNDLVVRYGGEEFTIILPNTDKDGACFFAEKLLDNIRDLKILHEKNEAANFVTVSIGVTTGKVGMHHDLSMFIKHADMALYTSKETGRNKYSYLDF